MSKLKLGVFGDSFAQVSSAKKYESLNIYPWPITLADMLDAELDCYALPGSSLWWSYKNFLKYYKELDVIVFVYTHYNRWNTLADKYQTLAGLLDEKRLKFVKKEEQEAGKLLIKCSEILFDEQFNIFTFQSMFDDINLRCKSDGKVLINVMPFENEICIDVSKKSGSVITSLLHVSLIENEHCFRFFDVFTKYRGDGKHCHLNSNNNYVCASLIQEVMNKNDIVKLIDDPRISYDPKYLDHIVLE